MLRKLDKLAETLTGKKNELVKLHPSELVALLEVAWNNRLNDATKDLGHPDRRSDMGGLGDAVLNTLVPPPPAVGTASLVSTLADALKRQGKSLLWDHLIYAYMIENTRIYEIFRRVVHEFVHGEKLGAPTPATQLWLRNTEELFFRDPPPFSITTTTSYCRMDWAASRRIAYQRMFGMDLNHGTEDNKPYPFVKPEAANTEFVRTFEELLREVWIAIVNLTTTSGPRPTDEEKIADLAKRLREMLITRRLHGNLSREEFVFVSMMSWFHLTVDSGDTFPVIVDLKAEGASAEQRLFKIAQRVGLPAHGLSKSYFEIAEDISHLFIVIETGVLDTAAAAPALFAGGQLTEAMKSIVTEWSSITGRDIKAGKVATS